MSKLTPNKHLVVTLVGVLFILFLLMFTDPKKMPLVILVMPFLLLFITIYSGTKLLLSQTRLKVNSRRQTMVASASAALPVLLLLFQSIHQLTLRDVLVAVSLVVLVVFYISRADFIR